jgi:hypothetical protein
MPESNAEIVKAGFKKFKTLEIAEAASIKSFSGPRDADA